MKWLPIVGLAGCAFALAPIMSASAMPAATPNELGATDEAVIQDRSISTGRRFEVHGDFVVNLLQQHRPKVTLAAYAYRSQRYLC